MNQSGRLRRSPAFPAATWLTGPTNVRRILCLVAGLSSVTAQYHQPAPRGGVEESVENHGAEVWLVLIVGFVAIPLLCCVNLQRKLPRRYCVGDNVLVRRNGNRLNKKHTAVVTAVHKERRPLGSIGQADEMEFIYCMLDALTCNHFKPRAYDVQFEAGGQEKALEAWVSPMPEGAEASLVAVVGGGVVKAEPAGVAVDATMVPDTSGDEALAERLASA